MAEHKREQVIEAFIAAITGLATTGSNVKRMLVYNIQVSELPTLIVRQSSDVPVVGDEGNRSQKFKDSELDIEVDYYVRANSDPDSVINQIDKEVIIAVEADATLGLSFVHDTYEGVISEPEVMSDGEYTIVKATKVFTVAYRMSETDPSQ